MAIAPRASAFLEVHILPPYDVIFQHVIATFYLRLKGESGLNII